MKTKTHRNTFLGNNPNLFPKTILVSSLKTRAEQVWKGSHFKCTVARPPIEPWYNIFVRILWTFISIFALPSTNRKSPSIFKSSTKSQKPLLHLQAAFTPSSLSLYSSIFLFMSPSTNLFNSCIYSITHRITGFQHRREQVYVLCIIRATASVISIWWVIFLFLALT
jgi:hypothetical protein